MSSRTRIGPFSVITNGDMSSSITSTATDLQSVSKISYQYSWTGTLPVGTIGVQVSNDCTVLTTGGITGGTWTTLILDVNGIPVDAIPLSGASGNGFIDLTDTSAFAIRLIYTRTSGTGTLTATIFGRVS